MDAITNGVFLLDARGHVSYSNPAAHRLLGDGDLVFQDRHGVLRSFDTSASITLGKALYDIGLSSVPTNPRQIVLRTKDGFAKSIATLAPFAPNSNNVDKFAAFAVGDVPVAIFTVATAKRSAVPHRDVLKNLYRLSPAEIELALALYAGETLYDFAERREVSRHTVRNQLRRVFEKTETNTQARLVSELNRLL